MFGQKYRPKRFCSFGFTLVEMLVALILASIIFVSAYQIISNLIQYQVRFTEKSKNQLDKILLRNMVSEILSKSIHQSDLYYKFRKEPFFQGRADSVTIISRAFSDHFDEPGYRVYKLSESGNELFVQYLRYEKDLLSENANLQSSGIEIKGISFSYSLEGEWVASWNISESVPERIKVRVTFNDNETLEWVNLTGQF